MSNEMDGTFAGHGNKSLTVETTPAGYVNLYAKRVDAEGMTRRVTLTLTPSEALALAAAVTSPGTTSEITTY